MDPPTKQMQPGPPKKYVDGPGPTRREVHIPALVATVLAKVLLHIFYRPPLSLSNVLGATQSAADGDFEAVCRDLNFRPRNFQEGLRTSA